MTDADVRVVTQFGHQPTCATILDRPCSCITAEIMEFVRMERGMVLDHAADVITGASATPPRAVRLLRRFARDVLAGES